MDALSCSPAERERVAKDIEVVISRVNEPIGLALTAINSCSHLKHLTLALLTLILNLIIINPLSVQQCRGVPEICGLALKVKDKDQALSDNNALMH